MRIWYIVIGAIAWQIITFGFYFISKQDEEKSMIVATLIPFSLAFISYRTFKYLYDFYIDKFYVSSKVNIRGISDWRSMSDQFRVKRSSLGKYYTSPTEDNQAYLSFDGYKQWKPSNCDSITKVNKNGWFDQEWVNNNLLKK